ncbi:Seryl-tRNA synthetase [hydrothermal vent metagenome]|uniref:Serine--tRNA ligase n=1 Tax=hydrothermal vent metagenome TaxID=652676 RepID=A0A3B1E1Q6_9ZZZZ
MIDNKLLQKEFKKVSLALARKGVDLKILNELRDDIGHTKLKRQKMEDIQAKQNALSSQFGTYKKDITPLKLEINILKKEKLKLEEEVREEEKFFISKLLSIPNLPDANVPDGKDESQNIVVKKVGVLKEFTFTPKEHWDLGESSGIIDFTRGVKLAKSRFTAMTGIAAKLERALINYFLDFNAKRGFTEWHVPFMANSATLQGTGQLPKFEDDLFKIEGEDLYLIPTAEVQLTNLYNNEIIPAENLPLKLTSYTPCFRKEAGSAGRDTRGIIRQHQFDKVELVAITTPEQSHEIFTQMVQCASDILTSLHLPHQVVQLCTGDLGFSASYTTDLEVWLAGQGKYREISSISNTCDFQARRAKIRYKDGKKNTLCHTLNGSSLAVGRTLVAIMENHQNEDGSINIPDVLKKYI